MRRSPNSAILFADPARAGDGYDRANSQVLPLNLWDFGARPNPAGTSTPNSTRALREAIKEADAFAEAASGVGVIYVPRGAYKIDPNEIIVPPRANSAIAIFGEHRRGCSLYALGAGTILTVGDGVTNSNYFELKRLTISGQNLATKGIHLRLCQSAVLSELIIEKYDVADGTGLFLEGSAGAGPPHTWRGCFEKIVCAETRRPLRILNADENTFLHTQWNMPLGAAVALAGIQIEQGRNNRFYSTLCGGDTGAARPNYRGIQLDNPALGNNSGHTFDGLVIEGTDIGFFVGSSVVQDVDVRRYGSSINRAAYNNGSDDGAVDNERRNNVTIELNGATTGGVRSFRAGGRNPGEVMTVANGDTSPTVVTGDMFSFNNAGATNVDNFDDGRPGDWKTFRLDVNTTIRHNAPGNIRTSGGANIVGTANDIVSFCFIGGLWFQATPVVAIP